MGWILLQYALAAILVPIGIMLLWAEWESSSIYRRQRRRAWEVIYLGDGMYNLKPPKEDSEKEGGKVQARGFMLPREAVKFLSDQGCIELHDGGCLFVDGRLLQGGSPYWIQLYPRSRRQPARGQMA